MIIPMISKLMLERESGIIRDKEDGYELNIRIVNYEGEIDYVHYKNVEEKKWERE